jgi:hypothetical protein
MSDQKRRPRGRPRSFDPEVALERARDLFWRAGYASTSLDQLTLAVRRVMEQGSKLSLARSFGG